MHEHCLHSTCFIVKPLPFPFTHLIDFSSTKNVELCFSNPSFNFRPQLQQNRKAPERSGGINKLSGVFFLCFKLAHNFFVNPVSCQKKPFFSCKRKSFNQSVFLEF